MKPKIRGRILLQLCIGMLCVVSSSLASTVTYNLSGFATGISDLNVGGSFYDVSFVFGSYNAVFGASSPTFLGDHPGADAAANAIGAVLNGEPISPIIGNKRSSGVLWTVYDVNVSGNRYFATQIGYQPSPWQRFGNFTDNLTADRSVDFDWAFAVFEPTAVPEPATLTLLGLGLGGLCLIRRKRAAC